MKLFQEFHGGQKQQPLGGRQGSKGPKPRRDSHEPYAGGVPVPQNAIAETFARHLSDKIKINISRTMVDPNGVYNLCDDEKTQ